MEQHKFTSAFPQAAPSSSNKRTATNEGAANVDRTEEPPKAHTTSLLCLPAELRNQIYYEVGIEAVAVHVTSRQPPALSRVCPQLRHEFEAVYYSSEIMTFRIYTGFSAPRCDLCPDRQTTRGSVTDKVLKYYRHLECADAPCMHLHSLAFADLKTSTFTAM